MRALARRPEAGLTLLEVLAALAIFLIGILAVLSLLTAGTRMHQDSQLLCRASEVANQVLLIAERELAGTPLAADAELPRRDTPLPVPGADRFTYRWWVRAGAASPPYLLEVEIGWQEGGKLRTHGVTQVLPDLQSQQRRVETYLLGRR